MKTLKALSIIVLFSCMSFACLSINSTDLINSTQNINNSDCLYIVDLNATINTTANIIPINANVSLNFSETYSNTPYNLSVSCPDIPPQRPILYNVSQVLSPGGLYFNPDANITIFGSNATYTALNQYYPLRHSEAYVNPFLNLTVVCEGPYTINRTVNLTVGQSYHDRTTNLTIFTYAPTPALNITPINQQFNLGCGQNQTFPGNLTVSGPACVNLRRTLNYSEHIIDTSNGIDLIAPPLPTLPTLNQNIDLTSGDNFTNTQIGLRVNCKPTQAQQITFCQNTTDANLSNIWREMNITNYTCGTYSYVCMDNLTSYCDPSEKFAGGTGLISCMNRIAGTTIKQCNETVDTNNICQVDLTNCRAGQKDASQTVDKIADSNTTMYVVIFAVIVAVFLIQHINSKKSKDVEVA